MLRKEVNDLLTQTGSGTPMGAMFRQYWMPALHAEELPEDDCPPVRVKFMIEGEEEIGSPNVEALVRERGLRPVNVRNNYKAFLDKNRH